MIGTRTVAAPRTLGSQVIAVTIASALLAAVTGPGWADEALETRQLVEQAKFAVESFETDPKMGTFRDLIKRAKGVFIAPQLLKAAFVVGASGGSGVLVVRDENTGQWHGPAFYTLGGASFGLQIGADASEVIVLAMTGRGVNAMLQPSVKLGADASLTVGPVGAGAGVATENLSVDLVAFSRSKGLYGGVSLQGAVLGVRSAWNQTYYGKPLTTRDILIRGEVNPRAAGFLAAVTKVAGPKRSAHRAE